MRPLLLALAASLALALAPQAASAQAAGKDAAVQLFKVITVKDETVIGASKEETERRGGGAAIEALAKALDGQGHLVVWQYAVRRTASGGSEYAALRPIAIFKQGVMRIEPLSTDFEIQPPPK
jgi:hypothetical protein